MTKKGSGEFYWNELMTSDAQAAETFYSTVLGWQATRWKLDNVEEPATGDEPFYTVMMAGDKPAAGIFDMAFAQNDAAKSGQQPPQWVGYVQVDEVDKVAETAQAAGATILHGPMELKMVGRFYLVRDPQGAMFGIITPDKACGEQA